MRTGRAGAARSDAGHHHFKDYKNEARIFQRRVVFSFLCALVMMGGLIFRFYDLQVVNFESYSTQSDRNRIQVRAVVPNRGLFFDNQGRILADNKAVQALSITKERVKDLDATIARLETLVDITDREKEAFRRALKWHRRPYQAIPIKYNLNEDELARIAVNEYNLPGVSIEGELVRDYPFDSLFTHVAGYVGRINEREQNAFTDDQKENYAGTNSIGKIGLEKFYEAILHGEVGQEKIETDARGRVLRVVDTIDPVAGQDIFLFLDIDLQKQAVKSMDGRRGAVVAIEIETGGVLAMLSSPSYNPNLFVTGISNKEYKALNKSYDLPLFNRTIQGQYPPGSTLKPMLGLGGLEVGTILPSTEVEDPGYYQLENDERLYRDWKPQGHGENVNLHKAIVQSCDVFFYDLGNRMGVDNMYAFGKNFGLGSKTNIDIPSERSGLWPSREWKKRERGTNWYPGNSLNMSIGQGDVLATPLQLASMIATMGNRGRFIEPRLVKKLNGVNTEKVVRSEYLGKKDNWDLVLKSMNDVVHSARGTARSISEKMTFKMSGKTGTAQVVSIAQDEEYDSEALSERNRDHALFVGFAPSENPKVAIAVVIENGEKSSEAGAVARDVMGLYLKLEAKRKKAADKKAKAGAVNGQ